MVEWIKKMWYTHAMEYYSAIKKKKIMPFVATWVQLEIIILSEARLSKGGKWREGEEEGRNGKCKLCEQESGTSPTWNRDKAPVGLADCPLLT